MGCGVGLWLTGTTLGTDSIVPGETVTSVTAVVAGTRGTTIGGLPECGGKEKNSGLSIVLVFFLVFISPGDTIRSEGLS